jgi:hypothetical protein
VAGKSSDENDSRSRDAGKRASTCLVGPKS